MSSISTPWKDILAGLAFVCRPSGARLRAQNPELKCIPEFRVRLCFASPPRNDAAAGRRRQSATGIVIALGAVAIGLFSALTPRPTHGRELYPGQYADVDPAIRQWFRDQKSPRSGIPCCSEADGTYAEEEIRDGHYRTRFTWRFCFARECQELDSGWMDVPDDVVIHDPNRHGAPVVWWYRGSGTDAGSAKVRIRCYAPGSGA